MGFEPHIFARYALSGLEIVSPLVDFTGLACSIEIELIRGTETD